LSSGSENRNLTDDDSRKGLVGQLQVLAEVASTETALFQQAAAAQYGLGITDMKTLSILMQEGPMTAGDIGNRLSLTSGSVTSLIDRLERQELVKRQAHATDRRKVMVAVNQEELAAGDNIYRSMGEAFSGLLEKYTTEQLEFLVEFYRASIEVTQQEIRKLAEKHP
jgi:MarR family transcriptional regulator, organic hydroperoxide resistance regulator